MQLAAATSPNNPWNFPALDLAVAQPAIAGLRAGTDALNRLIDRGIAVRVQLDRDLKTGAFSPDTVKAVELLARARDYALDTLDERHLSRAVTGPVYAWMRANARDNRLSYVGQAISDIHSAVRNLIDDEEGNVRESIAAMRTEPSTAVWNAIRETVDYGIESLYGARDITSALHVLRAASGQRS